MPLSLICRIRALAIKRLHGITALLYIFIRVSFLRICFHACFYSLSHKLDWLCVPAAVFNHVSSLVPGLIPCPSWQESVQVLFPKDRCTKLALFLVICPKNWGSPEFLLKLLGLFCEFFWEQDRYFSPSLLIYRTESVYFFLFSVNSIPLLSTVAPLQFLLFLFYFFFSYFCSIFFSISNFFFEWHHGKIVPHSFLQLLWLLHLVFSDFKSGSPGGCPSGDLCRCRKEQVFLLSKVCGAAALPGVEEHTASTSNSLEMPWLLVAPHPKHCVKSLIEAEIQMRVLKHKDFIFFKGCA